MTTERPWYDVDLTGRWRPDGKGWRADLPEFAWLGGPCPMLQVLENGTAVNASRHDGNSVWLPHRPADGAIATLPRVPSPVPGQVILVVGTLDGPFARNPLGWTVRLKTFRHFHDLPAETKGSPLQVLENGRPLGPARLAAVAMNDEPGSLHARDGVVTMVTSDGSDPNMNGRRYDLAVTTLECWPEPVLQWAGAQFRHLASGVPLPAYASLGLTNKCNLRCAICGSQSHLDRIGEARRFTDIAQIREIAATTFPFLREVELNSYGEPTLHPDFPEIIDLINRHRCLVKLQTNATLLRPAIIDSLARSSGFVWMSIDAVGPLFETARKLGRWSDVEAGVRTLMSRRDPSRLKIGLYPTVTRTTLPAMLEVLEWAHHTGIDWVTYHLYDPILGSHEERPSPEEIAAQEMRLRQWLEAHPDGPDVQMSTTWLKRSPRHDVPDSYQKVVVLSYPSHPMAERAEGAHPRHLCQAPWQQLDFGLDGDIHACCRSQKTSLGRADSIESFRAVWFGPTYQAIRQSLRRDDGRADILPDCAGCIRAHVSSVDAPPPASSGRAIVLHPPFQHDDGYCFLTASIGLDPIVGDSSDAPRRSIWTVYEGETPLAPGHAPHVDIRAQGGGAFSHWGGQLYFSTSDNSDPNTNGRHYTLRPPHLSPRTWSERLGEGFSRLTQLWRRTLKSDRAQIQRLAPPFSHVDGYCWRLDALDDFGPGDRPESLNSSPLVLYEDGRALGPMHTPHADIAAQGKGAFSHWDARLWFSTSDNSDPNTNGRCYEVRIDTRAFFAAHATRAVSIVGGWLGVLPPGTSVKGASVLEIGPGPEMGTLVLLAALGAREVIALDRRLPPWRPSWHPHLVKALAETAAMAGLPVDPTILSRAAKRGPKAVGITAVEQSIDHLPDRWHGKFGFSFSHAVLEHFEHPGASFAMIAAACAPGALGVHDVDFRDHRNFARPLDMLLLDDEAWVRENGDVLFRNGNRVRLPAMQDMLRQAGFTLLATEITHAVAEDYLEEFLPRLRASASPHAQTPLEHLTCASARLVLGRV